MSSYLRKKRGKICEGEGPPSHAARRTSKTAARRSLSLDDLHFRLFPRRHRDALARGIDDAKEKLPIGLRIRRRRLADLDQHRVLAFLQLHGEAMSIVAYAVAPFLEAEHLGAIDIDGEIVVGSAAHLRVQRTIYVKLRI